MKPRLSRAVAASLVLLLFLSFSACAPEFVGEAKAKQAGLTLLRQAFGVSATDAHVEYFERAGTSVVDNSDVKPGANTQIYIVTISDQTIGADLYYAEVDAVTGVAYYATKNEFLLAPASQQAASGSDSEQTATKENAALEADCAKDAASDFVMHRFQKEVALISPESGCRWGGDRSSRACIGYFVTFADGALYRVGFSWPAMDLNEIHVLGTEPEGERP